MNPLMLFLCFTTFSLLLFPQANAVWIEIPGSGTKCVSEEIHTNVVVLAEYYLFTHHEAMTVTAKVTSPYGNTLHYNENVIHGQFAFTTTETGSYPIFSYLNLFFLKPRWEAKMREVGERTNARVAWYGFMSLGVCILGAALQVWHLKRFFHKKKLI
ncbi:hypothetical protein Lal_00030814 [Lupinus albus]|uniref:Uncharacterized protein n=1 Tax=Lupinus albus TaxID=3870 RepID=A0A6A4P805_LUPAL|nr:hypothetical protein Lalb_Chr17g0343841 [Lupinus albus]KAF1863726.1 hypothetical protein Lal_00030814 [Lupinus albus]